jgi:hypothetical protein
MQFKFYLVLAFFSETEETSGVNTLYDSSSSDDELSATLPVSQSA